jgi:hypothetical protein
MKFKKALGATLAIIGLGTALTISACTSTPMATTSDMCAYTQGTGRDGADALVHKVYYPGQQFSKDSRENTFTFPCNARNIRFANGSTDVWADGNRIGTITARTKDGTEVLIDIRMDWTLNQTEDVLKNVFVPICKKANCASTNSDVRNDNFSTDGWSKGLLGENATPTFYNATIDVVREYGDEVWTNPVLKDEVGQKVSMLFMQRFHANTGSTKDMFCGSGDSSGWSGAVGTSTFNCAPVRVTAEHIEVKDKSRLDAQAREAKAKAEQAANAAELTAAKAKYGTEAEKVLGDLARIQACRDAGMTQCGVNGFNVGTATK